MIDRMDDLVIYTRCSTVLAVPVPSVLFYTLAEEPHWGQTEQTKCSAWSSFGLFLSGSGVRAVNAGHGGTFHSVFSPDHSGRQTFITFCTVAH